MQINADLSEPAVVEAYALDWVPSPAKGVWRRMLDRDGAERGRATSIVRYDPGSKFPTHKHPGGEEYLVLEGTFSDDYGDFPAGTYVRNPAGSSHAPHTDGGCTIFVKLWQMDQADQDYVRMDTNRGRWEKTEIDGLERLYLHKFRNELVWLSRLAPGTAMPPHVHERGEEVLVLEGEVEDENGVYPTGTWFRLPAGSRHAPKSKTGALMWVKTGHLA